jgi:hypothetical protein
LTATKGIGWGLNGGFISSAKVFPNSADLRFEPGCVCGKAAATLRLVKNLPIQKAGWKRQDTIGEIL